MLIYKFNLNILIVFLIICHVRILKNNSRWSTFRWSQYRIIYIYSKLQWIVQFSAIYCSKLQPGLFERTKLLIDADGISSSALGLLRKIRECTQSRGEKIWTGGGIFYGHRWETTLSVQNHLYVYLGIGWIEK